MVIEKHSYLLVFQTHDMDSKAATLFKDHSISACFSLVGLGGGGGGFGDITCDLAQLPVLLGGPPPTPTPHSQLPRQKLWSLISRWDQTGLRGGGEGCFLGQNHTNLKPLEKQRYLE